MPLLYSNFRIVDLGSDSNVRLGLDRFQIRAQMYDQQQKYGEVFICATDQYTLAAMIVAALEP